MTRRASALFATLVIVSIAAMLGAIVMTAGDSTASASDRHLERMSLRAAAWSGIQSIMAELGAQRAALLDGVDPTLSPEQTLTEARGERLVVRLLPWELDVADARAEKPLALPEAAKLDLNRVDGAMLAALGLSEAAAGELIAKRGIRAFTSVEELATLQNATIDAVFGAPAEDSTGEGARANSAEAPALPWSRTLTTLAFDPNVQTGLASPDWAGRLRINIGKGWSDEVASVLTEELGAGPAESVKKLVEQTRDLPDDAALVAALQQFGVPKELMPAALDVLTAADDLYVPGRVDAARASAEVLAAVPGIGKEKAPAIAGARGQLTQDERRSRAWLLTRGLLTPEEFQKAAPWLTSRCLQWRVRVEAALERGGDGSGGEAQVLRSAVYEAVVDVASDRPRLAYWREITLLPIARAMERRVSAMAKALEESKPREPAPAEPAEAPEPPEPSAEPPPAAPPAAAPPPAPPKDEDGTMKDRRTGRWKATGGPA